MENVEQQRHRHQHEYRGENDGSNRLLSGREMIGGERRAKHSPCIPKQMHIAEVGHNSLLWPIFQASVNIANNRFGFL